MTKFNRLIVYHQELSGLLLPSFYLLISLNFITTRTLLACCSPLESSIWASFLSWLKNSFYCSAIWVQCIVLNSFVRCFSSVWPAHVLLRHPDSLSVPVPPLLTTAVLSSVLQVKVCQMLYMVAQMFWCLYWRNLNYVSVFLTTAFTLQSPWQSSQSSSNTRWGFFLSLTSIVTD